MLKKGILPVVVSWSLLVSSRGAMGAAFDEYVLLDSFALPGAGAGPFDTLPDGRIISLDLDDVHVETATGSRTFTMIGVLPGADFSMFGAAFIRVSPDGTRIAVGNGGGASFANFEVGVFAFPTLTGTWMAVDGFDAAWESDETLALSAGSFTTGDITLLFVDSPDPMNPINPVVIAGIGGASGGIAFDASGNLYTGNGFEGGGPSGTGHVKVFSNAAWTNAVKTATLLSFETDGTLVIDVLSAASLGFDARANLHVGGGDYIGGTDLNFAVLARASAVADAVAGMGPVDAGNPTHVRKLDPDGTNDSNFYVVDFNESTNELYVRDSGASDVYVYAAGPPIPTVSQWGALSMFLLLLIGGTVVFGGDRGEARGSRRRLVLSEGEKA